jgi:transcriptional regulator with GAF, ATPase, and Fis domain
VPPTLFESELFGYRKGAFSGAIEDHPGLVRAADGGTLFLDEIGDLSAASQVALLRVLQEREVLPLGATRPVKVNLRVVTASHRDLATLVARGQFREDLLARLSGYKVALPPLRERREDLGILIAALLERAGGDVKLTCRAARALFNHRWPLNVRELEKALNTAAALAGAEAIDLRHLPEDLRAAGDRPATSIQPRPAEAAELGDEERERRDRLVALLTETEGNVAHVARSFGKAPMQIHRWLKRYGIELRAFRRPS